MKNLYFKLMPAWLTRLLIFCCLLGTFLLVKTSSNAQTPGYYNFATNTATNTFPFSVAAGKEVQWMIDPGEFVLPSPAPSGNITQIWFRPAGTGTATFTSLQIKLGQTTLTSFPAGAIYTGPLTTVYGPTNTAIAATASTWFSITLATPFTYNPAQSLVVDVSQCGYTGTGFTMGQVTLTPSPRRTYINGTTACVFTYAGQDGTCGLIGITLATGPCTNPPTAGTATATPTVLCSGGTVTLNLTGNSSGTGQTYQWQRNLGAGWVNIGGVLTSPGFTDNPPSSASYQCIVTCGSSVTSAPVSVTVTSGMSGTYTINFALPTGGTNFHTFNDAVAALNCITGPVIFNVVSGSGPYTEQVTIPQIAGMSAVNTVTFNGNGNTLQFASTVSPVLSVLELNGADYFTFNNLIVSQTGTIASFAVHLWNGANNNTFSGCTMQTPPESTLTNVPFSISGSQTSATTSGTPTSNNNVVTGCTIKNGYYNVTLYGYSTTPTAMTGNQILNCSIKDQYAYGIYTYYNTGTIISGNVIERPTRIAVSTFYGVYLSTGVTNILIEKNRIRNAFGAIPTSASSAYGIYDAVAGALGTENKIYNNLISDNASNGAVYGIYLSAANYTNVYHNTIALLDLTSSSSTTYGIYNSGTTGTNIRNNIVDIRRGGTSTKYCIYMAGVAALCNNNDLYMASPAGTNYIGYYTTTGLTYATLAAWQATGYDLASQSVDPGYVSPPTGVYQPTSSVMNNIGAPVGVTTDITGAARSGVTPDAGAYEYNPPVLDANIQWISPLNPQVPGLKTITVRITNNAITTITSVDLRYTDGITTVNQSFTGLSIPPAGYLDLSFTTPYNLTASITMTASIILVNGVADDIASNNAVNYSFCLGVSGVYTINAALPTGGTNFQTFAAAISYLSCGVVGPVIFNVVAASGPYNEQVSIPAIGGTSAVNTVTFNGNGNTLTYAATVSTAPHTLVLNDADYFIFNNLTIIGTGTTYAFACHLWNNADHNTFNNCTFTVPPDLTASALVPYSISASATSATTAGVANGTYNVADGCTMNNGYYCAVLYGNTSATVTPGNEIKNCTLNDSYYYAIYSYYQGNGIYRGNIMQRNNRLAPTTFAGVYMYYGWDMAIEKNIIRNPFAAVVTSTSTAYGIYNAYGCYYGGTQNLVVNNLIYNFNSEGPVYGIYNSTNSINSKIYHNTIAINHMASTSASTCYGLYNIGTSGVEIRNNIIDIRRGGTATKYCLYLSGAPATCDNNDLYMNSSGTSNYIGYSGATYATLALWQGTGFDLSSMSVDPAYTNPGIGDYRPTNFAINNIGAPVGVTTDITGMTRNAVFPDPGAYEFNIPGLDAAIQWFSPTGPQLPGLKTITVQVGNAASITITSLELQYSDGTTTVTQTFTGLNIAANVNQTLSFTTQYNLSGYQNMTVSILLVNGTTDLNPANNADSYNLCTGMSGTYTINSALPTGGANFQTFTDAVNALSCGIFGPVVFNVAAGSGPYNEQINIPAIAGSSAVNTITFNGNGTTLVYAATLSTAPHTLLLSGADYVTFNNINVIASGTSYGFACHLYNNSDYNTFNNCTFTVDAAATSSTVVPYSISASATSATTSGAANGTYNVANGCTMNYGYYGVVLYGNSSSVVTPGNQVINCTINDPYYYCLYSYYQGSGLYNSNIMQRNTRTTLNTFAGVYMYYGQNMVIEKNIIRKPYAAAPTSTGTAYGIYNYYGCYYGGTQNLIVNNLLYDFNFDGSIYGIYNSTSSINSKIYHNTIAVNYLASISTGTVYGLYNVGTTGVDIRNNIIDIRMGGTGTKYCIYMSGVAPTCNNNDLYMNSPAGTNYIGYYTTTAISYATLAAWQATGYDLASQSVDPLYINPSGGLYMPYNIIIDNIGANVGVLTDITGAPRSVTPDPGAYEFAVLPCTGTPNPGNTLTTGNFLCPGASFTLSWQNLVLGLGITYQWQSSPDGITWTNIPGATATSLTTSQAADTYYRCALTCTYNSVIGYSSTLLETTRGTMNGTYTIDPALPTSATNFQSFNEMVNALICGISGPVIINVSPGSGPYVEQIAIPQIPGASAVNTITINGNNTTITQNAPGSTQPWTVGLNGADYIRFNDMNMVGQGTSYALVCHLWNDADHNIFTNCTFTANLLGTSTTQVPFSISGSATSVTTTGASGSHNTIIGCTMSGGYYNTVFYGNSTTPNIGNELINCNIRDFYYYGVYVLYQNGITISGNTIERPNRTNPSTFNGLYLSTGTTKLLVEKNKIRNPFGGNTTGGNTAYYIYLSVDGTLGVENQIFDNLLSDVNGIGPVYGMYFSGADYFKAYHNTIAFNDPTANATGATYGFYSSGTVGGMDFRNNIININRGGSGTRYGIYYTSSVGHTSNYNDIYMNSASGLQYTGYYSVGYVTLANWKTANAGAWDQQSKDVDPYYVNPGAGNYQPTNGIINNIGAAVGVTTDITGAPRNMPAPDPGAYEFVPPALDAGILWSSPLSPQTPGLKTITVTITNAAATTITSLDLRYSDGITTVNESFTGLSIPYGGTQNFSFTTQYNMTGYSVITASIILVNGVTDGNALNNFVSYALCNGISGTYTINSSLPTVGTNFQTFTAAVAALSCGITGPVVFNVAPGSGPYNEQIDIPAIPGTSSVNTVSFYGHGRTLTYAATIAAAPHTLSLSGADYLRFYNLHVDGTGATYAMSCVLWNNSDWNIFDTCTFSCSVTATGSSLVPFCISGSNSSPSTAAPSGNHNMVMNSTMIGGYYGASFYGGGASAFAVDNHLTHCTVSEFYYYGVRFYYQDAPVALLNTIERPTRTTVSTFYGLYLYYISNANISKNRIRNPFGGAVTSTSSAYCIYHTSNTVTSAANCNNITNNLLTDLNSNGLIYAIYNSGSYGHFYHNTVAINHMASSSASATYGIYNAIATGADFRNNIIDIRRGGTATKYCIYMSSVAPTCNYNDLYMASAGTTNYIGYYTTTAQTYATLALWQAGSGYDLASQSVDPLYTNPATGNYQPTNNVINNIGAAVGVATDIVGAARSAFTPDPGAWEMALSNCSGWPYGGQTVANINPACPGDSVTLSLSGASLAAGLTYQWVTSPTGGLGNWNYIVGATSPIYKFVPPVGSNFYKCILYCQYSYLYGPSDSLQVTGLSSCYCTPTYTNTVNTNLQCTNGNGCTDNDGIINFTLNGFSFPSLCSCPYAYSFTPTPVISPLGQGLGYPFSITPASTYSEYQTIWIDLNDDGIFDASEMVYQATTAVAGVRTGTLTIPNCAPVGAHRLRLVQAFGGIVPADSACGTFVYGETEDYMVNIIYVQPTPALATQISGPSTGVCNVVYTFTVDSGYVNTFQWQFALDIAGPYIDITGAVSDTQSLVANGPATFYLRIQFNGIGCTPDAYSLPFPIVITSPSCEITSPIGPSGSTLCRGNNLVLTASSNSTQTWLWSTGATTQSITVSPLDATTYTVTTGSGLCTCTASYTVNVAGPVAMPNLAPLATQCPGSPVNLTANLLTGTPSGEGPYTVSSIAYAPVSGTPTSITLSDDQLSAAIPIGFNFTFYGSAYNNVYISSNGFITFTSTAGPGCCAGQYIPNPSGPNNVIALDWEDLYPPAGGTIEYFNAPGKFVVQYSGIGHFSTGSYPLNGQIVLNANGTIEIHVSSIATDNDQIGETMGIENSTGTLATTVSGRNSADPWTATNEGWLFSPPVVVPYVFNGPVTYSWTGSNGFISSLPNPSDNPLVTTTYTLIVADNSCSSPSYLSANVFVSPTVVASNNGQICSGDTVQLSATGSPVSILDTLLTPMLGGNGFNGNAFDIIATNSVIIHYFTININSTSAGNAEVWYKLGGYGNANLTSSAGWTLAGNVPIVGQGIGNRTLIPLDVNLPIASGQTYGFVLLSDLSVTYTNGTLVGAPLVSDANITITQGHGGSGYGGTGTWSLLNSPRNLNGSVSYGTSGTASYLWTGPNIINPTNQNTPAYPTATTTYTVMVTDNNGCTGTSGTTVEVILPFFASCAPDVTQAADPGACGTLVNIGTAIAGQQPCTNLISNNGIGFYPVGQTPVVWTVTDQYNNTATCVQTITVTDNELPVVTCPANINNTADAGVCSYTVNPGTATATDNCGIDQIIGVRSDALALTDPYPVGTTNITWTATDIHSNASSCVQTIIVTDNELPVITCPADISNTADAGLCSYTVDPGIATATDNCGVAQLGGVRSDALPILNPYPVGTTYIVWTAIDVNGNSMNCTQTIVVTDNEIPSVTCGQDIIQVNDPGFCGAEVQVDPPLNWDNCGIYSVVSDHPASYYPVGTTAVLWTVMDIHGNMNTCQQLVTVNDTELPTITCGQNVSVPNDAMYCGANVIVPPPIAADNCGYVSVQNDFNGFADASGYYPVGTTVVTWKATDGAGLTSICTQLVTVNDTELPVLIACAPDKILCFGNAYYDVYTEPPQAMDNCGPNGIVMTHDHIPPFQIGDNYVTWTIKDQAGNSITCLQHIVLSGTISVSISESMLPTFCQGQGITLTANIDTAGTAAVSYLWSSGQTTQSIFVSTSGTYCVTATNALGCTASACYTATVSIPDLLSSYVMLTRNHVKLERSTVYSGGLGVKGGKDAKIEAKKYSSVTAAGTFAKALHINIDGTSTITNKYWANANVAWPPFEVGATTGGINVNVPNGTTLTLTGSLYKEIKVGKNATVIFTQAVVDITKKMNLEDGATVLFNNSCTKIRMHEQLEAKKNVTINPTEMTTIWYIDHDVHFDGGANVNGIFYLGSPTSQDTVKHHMHIKSSKKNDRPAVFKGMFLAECIHSGEYTSWYMSTICDPCVFPRDAEVANADNVIANSSVVDNYPNPFNNTTSILFTLPEDNHANLEVYDLSGKLIQSLFNGDVNANQQYTFEFDGSALATGVYIYKLTTNENVFTGKMILSRE